MNKTLMGLALVAACSGNKDETQPEPEPEDTTTYLSVMRDCPPDVGNICPWVGAGYNGYNGDDVHRLDAWMSFPMSVAFPPAGSGLNPVLADWNNHKLREVEPNPEDGLNTVMGTDFLGDGDDALLDRTEGALGTDVALNHPTMQVFLSDGTLLSDSWHTHKFRTWDPATGMVHVVLGSRPGMSTVDHDSDPATPAVPVDFDQDASTVLLNQPKELFVDPTDENLVYYVDMRNERIRVWDRLEGTVNTIAGETVDGPDGDTAVGSKGYCGEGDALQTCFNFPKNANPEPGGAIAVTADGSTMYIADSEAHVIRVLDLTTGQISLLSGEPPTYEDTDGDPNTPLAMVAHPGFADGPVADAKWAYPVDFALDDTTNELFVADANNHRIRKIDLNTMTVSTVAGTGSPSCDIIDLLVPAVCDEQHSSGDGGPAVSAPLYRPFGVDLDNDGNLIVADTYNHRFRIIYR